MLSRCHKCFLYVKPKAADVKPKVADELKTPRIPAVFADGKDIAQQQSHASQSYQLGDASPLQKSLTAFFEKIGLMHTSDFRMGLRSLEKLSEQHGQVSFGTLFAGATWLTLTSVNNQMQVTHCEQGWQRACASLPQ